VALAALGAFFIYKYSNCQNGGQQGKNKPYKKNSNHDPES
jgi:hypothetical protein